MLIVRLEIPVAVTHSGGELYKVEIPMTQSMECHHFHFLVFRATWGQLDTLARTCGRILSMLDVLGMPNIHISRKEKKNKYGDLFEC